MVFHLFLLHKMLYIVDQCHSFFIKFGLQSHFVRLLADNFNISSLKYFQIKTLTLIVVICLICYMYYKFILLNCNNLTLVLY